MGYCYCQLSGHQKVANEGCNSIELEEVSVHTKKRPPPRNVKMDYYLPVWGDREGWERGEVA